MNRLVRILLPLIALLGAMPVLRGAGTPPPLPPGALLYVEAPDTRNLLEEIRGGKGWMALTKGPVWEVFVRSRIFMKLGDRATQLEGALGRPLDGALLNALAGGEASLAIFDLGQPDLVLAVRLPAGPGRKLLEQLFRTLPEQKHLGVSFWGRPSENGRLFAGAATLGDWICLATSQRALKETIRAHVEGGSHVIQALPGEAALRVDVDLETLRNTPQFRYYWKRKENAATTGKARMLASFRRQGSGWIEERFLLETGASLPSGPLPVTRMPRPEKASPFWSVRQGPQAKEILNLLWCGVLRLRTDARKELAPAGCYTGAAFGLASQEQSDLLQRIDKAPDTVDVAGMTAGLGGAATAAETLLGQLPSRSVRWAWNLDEPASAGGFFRQQGVLVLEVPGAGEKEARALRDVVGRALAAVFLTSPSDLSWEPLEKGRMSWHCREPREIVVECPSSGWLLVATSPEMAAQGRTLAALSVTGEAACLDLGAAGGKYRTFLRELYRGQPQKAGEEPRLLDDLVPALLDVLGTIRSVEAVRMIVPGGTFQRIDWVGGSGPAGP